VDGKEIKRSLGTTHRTLARRNLAALKAELRQIDRSQGRITLEELADRYLATIRHQKPKTVGRKTFIVGRIKDHWPTGSLTQAKRVNAQPYAMSRISCVVLVVSLNRELRRTARLLLVALKP